MYLWFLIVIYVCLVIYENYLYKRYSPYIFTYSIPVLTKSKEFNKDIPSGFNSFISWYKKNRNSDIDIKKITEKELRVYGEAFNPYTNGTFTFVRHIVFVQENKITVKGILSWNVIFGYILLGIPYFLMSANENRLYVLLVSGAAFYFVAYVTSAKFLEDFSNYYGQGEPA